uniref:DUF6598 domain-containing protein n=1 Tax=Leersia perrieri TaxID=77586 RepID=A0A0D9XYY3_9ORYZ
MEREVGRRSSWRSRASTRSPFSTLSCRKSQGLRRRRGASVTISAASAPYLCLHRPSPDRDSARPTPFTSPIRSRLPKAARRSSDSGCICARCRTRVVSPFNRGDALAAPSIQGSVDPVRRWADALDCANASPRQGHQYEGVGVMKSAGSSFNLGYKNGRATKGHLGDDKENARMATDSEEHDRTEGDSGISTSSDEDAWDSEEEAGMSTDSEDNSCYNPTDIVVLTVMVQYTRTPANGKIVIVFQTLARGSLIEMSGPKRGIEILSDVLIEFDMRIKKGVEQEDDLQLIDGVCAFGCIGTTTGVTFKQHIYGDCGAVEIKVAHLPNAVEATVEVAILEVQSHFNLSIGYYVAWLPDEMQLFHGDIVESCGLRKFVLAAVMDNLVQLKFKISQRGSYAERCCSFEANRHGYSCQQINTEFASFMVKVTWLTLDLRGYRNKSV